MSQRDMQMVPMVPITIIDSAEDIQMSIRDRNSMEINSRYLLTISWPFPAIMGQPLIYQRTEGSDTITAHVDLPVNDDDDDANELYFTMLCLHRQDEFQQAPIPVEQLYNLPEPTPKTKHRLQNPPPASNSSHESHGTRKALAQEWDTVRSKTKVPLESVADCPNDSRCPSPPPETIPEIQLYRGPEHVAVYAGPQTADEILRFIDRAKRSSQIPVHVSPAEAEGFKDVDDFVCIAHLQPSETSLREAFEDVAKKYWTEFTFGIVDTQAADSKVVCRKRDDASTHTSSSPDGLEAWLIEASRPLITDLSRATHDRLLKRGWPMVYIFHPSAATRASIRAQLSSFAKSQYASLTSVTVAPAYFPDLPGKLGLDPARDGYPAGAVHQLSNGRVYRYPKDRGFTPKELQGWGLDVWQGRVKPWTPPGQEEPKEEKVGGANVRIVGSSNLKVKNIPGLKIKIGGQERDEL
ncbi:protein disulfide-isomerase [Colletotrichum asianum]